jgi:hypothetical protein
MSRIIPGFTPLEQANFTITNQATEVIRDTYNGIGIIAPLILDN